MTPKPKRDTPRCRKAEIALDFVEFLEAIIGDVWDRHGPEMYKLIEKRADDLRKQKSSAYDSYDECNAKLPF